MEKNRFRNEKEITLAGEKILLRPTFENIAAMEQNVGSIQYLVWKYSRGAGKVVSDSTVKSLPGLTEIAQIIYFNQAATRPEDPTLKKFSLEEIWELVMAEGMAVTKSVVEFLGSMVSGSKLSPDDLEEEKKS